ncbi:MAG: DUF4185 domain-containing protein [Acidobacteriota bacterium]
MTRRPGPRIRAVVEHGPAPRTRGDTADGGGWMLVGQDGGQSIPLADGRHLVVFADTLLAETPLATGGAVSNGIRVEQLRSGGGRFLGNCAALSPATAPETSNWAETLGALEYFRDADGWPRPVLEPTPAEEALGVRLWPQHGLSLDPSRVLLAYLAIQHLGADTWGFGEIGSGLAVVDLATGTGERLRFRDDAPDEPGHDEWCTWPSIDDGLHAGVCFLRVDRVVYVYATHRTGFTWHALVARVDADRVADPLAYRYFAGATSSAIESDARWSPERGEAVPLCPCGGELTASWNAHLGAFLLTTIDSHRSALVLRTAPAPWGPWSDPSEVRGLHRAPRNELVGLAFEHASMARDGGRRIEVSYCQPRFEQNRLLTITFADPSKRTKSRSART